MLSPSKVISNIGGSCSEALCKRHYSSSVVTVGWSNTTGPKCYPCHRILQQLSKPATVSSASWDARALDSWRREEQRVSASRTGNIFVAALENYLAKRHALTSSIDLDHQHTEPSVPQNHKDFYSSLELIFTNQTSIFLILKIWYDITREIFVSTKARWDSQSFMAIFFLRDCLTNNQRTSARKHFKMKSDLQFNSVAVVWLFK